MSKSACMAAVALFAVCADASADRPAPAVPNELLQQIQNQPATACASDTPQIHVRRGQRFYPPKAVEREQQGWGVIRFDVLADGKIGAVTVVAEAPEGLGFGEAAAQMVKAREYPPHPNGCPGILFFTAFSLK